MSSYPSIYEIPLDLACKLAEFPPELKLTLQLELALAPDLVFPPGLEHTPWRELPQAQLVHTRGVIIPLLPKSSVILYEHENQIIVILQIKNFL